MCKLKEYMFIFNTYANADLIDFKDDYIELKMNDFKVLLDYDCNLISKKRHYTNELCNYENIISPHSFANSQTNVQRLEVYNILSKFKDYYSNLNDFEELRKLSKVCQTSSHSIVKWKDYRLDIWSWYPSHTCMNMAYVVSDQPSNKITSVLLCDESLQLGDCETYIYLINDKHILVYNAGDVWSTVVIKDIIN